MLPGLTALQSSCEFCDIRAHECGTTLKSYKSTGGRRKKKGKAVFAPHLVSILSQAFCFGRAASPRRRLLSSRFRPQGPQWWEECLMRIARAQHPTLHKVLLHRRPCVILMQCYRNKGQAVLFRFVDEEFKYWRWWGLWVSGDSSSCLMQPNQLPVVHPLCLSVISMDYRVLNPELLQRSTGGFLLFFFFFTCVHGIWNIWFYCQGLIIWCFP